MSGEVVLMTLVGGLGTIFGPVVGRLLRGHAWRTTSTTIGQWVFVVQGVDFRGLRAAVPPRHRRRAGAAVAHQALIHGSWLIYFPAIGMPFCVQVLPAHGRRPDRSDIRGEIDAASIDRGQRPRCHDLSRLAARHYRAGLGARRQAPRRCDRRTVRGEPHDRAPCAGPACGRRAGRAAPQSRRRGRDPELGRGTRYLRCPARPRAADRVAAGRPARAPSRSIGSKPMSTTRSARAGPTSRSRSGSRPNSISCSPR